jgi:predicted ATPase
MTARYDDGAWFVDLTSSTDPKLLPSTLAGALGLPPLPEAHIPVLTGFVRNKRMLIVLDNCEHVVEAAAELDEAHLKGAAGIHILTTSLEPLRAQGEWLRRLSPLEAPPPAIPRSELRKRSHFRSNCLWTAPGRVWIRSN